MDGDWETLWRPASPPLRPYVAGYLAYRQTGAAPGSHRGLPSPYLTMIVAVDDPLTMLAHADPAQAGGDFWTRADFPRTGEIDVLRHASPRGGGPRSTSPRPRVP